MINNNTNKARRVSSPIIKSILDSINPMKKKQVRNRIKIACQLDDLIKSKGYKSYAEFAKKMDRHSSEISKWLSGSHNFTIDTLTELCHHLDIELSDIFAREKIETLQTNEIRLKLKIDSTNRESYSCFNYKAVETPIYPVLNISTKKEQEFHQSPKFLLS